MNPLKILSWVGIGLTIAGAAVTAIVTPAITKQDNQKYIDSLMKNVNK